MALYSVRVLKMMNIWMEEITISRPKYSFELFESQQSLLIICLIKIKVEIFYGGQSLFDHLS
jgi:hypothetical protein